MKVHVKLMDFHDKSNAFDSYIKAYSLHLVIKCLSIVLDRIWLGFYQ